MGVMKDIAIKSEDICRLCNSSFCKGCRQYIGTANRKGESIIVKLNPNTHQIEGVENVKSR